MKNLKSRIWVFLLAALLVLGLFPASALAASATLDATPSGAAVTKNAFSLTATGASALTVTYNGKKISNTQVKFASSKSSVASVSKKGVISAKKPGKATISVKYKGKTKKLYLTVTKPGIAARAAGKYLKSNTLTVSPKSKTQLSMVVNYKNSGVKEVTPKVIKNKKVRWSSSRKSVATVSKTGLVYAKKTGKTVITMKHGYATKKITINVTKNAPPLEAQTTQPSDPDENYANGVEVVFDWGYKMASEKENHRETYRYPLSGGKYTLYKVPTPVRDGYYFMGWEGADGKALHPAGKDNISSRIYYAKWDPYPLPVLTYHVNDGSGNKFTVFQSAIGFYGMQSDGEREKIDPADFSDKIFLGWYDGPNAPVYEYTEYSCACGKVFKSSEEYQDHALEVYMDGRSHSYSMREVFSGSVLYPAGMGVGDDMDLYAHWSDGVQVSFDAGLPQYDYPDIIVLKGKTIRKSLGNSLKWTYVMPRPSWPGHKFVGWFTPDGEEADIDTVFCENTLLIAKWDVLT